MIARYKPYPEYKPSGVEWLGGLPVAVEKAVIDSMDIHENLARQLLEDEHKAANFRTLLMELLVKNTAA